MAARIITLKLNKKMVIRNMERAQTKSDYSNEVVYGWRQNPSCLFYFPWKSNEQTSLKPLEKKVLRVSDDKIVDITKIPENDTNLYYKDEPYTTKGLHQGLIVTYSPKSALYQKTIQEKQVECTSKMGCFRKSKKIEKETQSNGLYAVCTDSLDDDVANILKASEGRWQIEECFRIMKTDFSARPVYLQDGTRIKAHFLICFLVLLSYRLLEKKPDNKYTCETILETLKNMNLAEIQQQDFRCSPKALSWIQRCNSGTQG